MSASRGVAGISPAFESGKTVNGHPLPDVHSQAFLLQVVQPGLSGLMDGSLSTLAPIFAVALATGP